MPTPAELGRKIRSLEVVWRCARCGYQRTGTRRPALCPACESESESFEGLPAVEWRRRLGG
jgi:rubrerythrin